MSDEKPTRYLNMTLRVYGLNTETGERTYLPVSKPNEANGGWYPNCSCPACKPLRDEPDGG